MTNEPIQRQQPYTSQNPFNEETISLMDILLILAQHLKLIVITPSIFCIIAIIYFLIDISPPKYISTAKFKSLGGNEQSQIPGWVSQFGFLNSKNSASQWSYTDIISSKSFSRNMLDYKFDTSEM